MSWCNGDCAASSGSSRSRPFLAVLAAVGIVLTSLSTRAEVLLEEMVPMSDGVRLYTQIHLPDVSGGPWPTIMARTPYTRFGSNDDLVSEAFEMAALFGYAVVMQHTRGQGTSEGETLPFFTDRDDGHDTIDWTLSQPWCDGRILMAGGSALAIPAYLAAPGADPGLQCQMLAIATPDVYDTVFHGGVFRKHDVEKWTSWVGKSGDLEILSDHRNCDAFWDPVRVLGSGEHVRSTALHLGGWFDVFTQGTLDGYDAWRRSTDAWVADRQYLVMGPWEHDRVGETRCGDFTFPDSAKFDFAAAALGWLQWCFDGYHWEVDAWPRVRYYVMGAVGEADAPGNEWRAADDWPPFPVVDTPFFLLPEGRLDLDSAGESDEFHVAFNPANPSPTTGGRNLSLAAGPKDQARVESRSDALVFTTDVLDEPFESTGRIAARLFVSTDGPDADVAVRLTDVYPDGRSMLVTEGIARLSRREGCEGPVAVEPGRIYELVVDLWTTSMIFNAGHRIRVVVTGSNSPRYEVNPAVTAPIEIAIHAGPGHPSAIVLPVPDPLPPQPDVVETASDEAVPPETAEDVVIADVHDASDAAIEDAARHDQGHVPGDDAGVQVDAADDAAEDRPGHDSTATDVDGSDGWPLDAPGPDFSSPGSGGKGGGCSVRFGPNRVVGEGFLLLLTAVLLAGMRRRRVRG
jgi:hypothetical protein